MFSRERTTGVTIGLGTSNEIDYLSVERSRAANHLNAWRRR
jgi:hypothetical protein